MKRSLTKMKELTRILLVGETQAGSAEVQPARDSQLKATNCRWGGSYTVAIPFYEQRQFRALLCLKKPLAEGEESLLTAKWICPIHAEPVQKYLTSSIFLLFYYYLITNVSTLSVPKLFWLPPSFSQLCPSFQRCLLLLYACCVLDTAPSSNTNTVFLSANQ